MQAQPQILTKRSEGIGLSVIDVFYPRIKQEIDIFGEVSGISFSPCGDSLFVGIADRVYGSMMQFRRSRRGLLSREDLWP